MLRQGGPKKYPTISKNIAKSPSKHNQSNQYHSYCSQIQLQAHELIRNFKQVKEVKQTQNRDKKLKKIYNTLLRIIQKIFDQKFMTNISRELMNILNQLIFFYEGPITENIFSHTQRNNEKHPLKKGIEISVLQANNNHQNIKHTLNIQFQKNKKTHTKKKSNLAVTDRVQYATNIRNTNNLEQSAVLQQNQTQHQLKIFVYSQLKQIYKKVQKEKEILNAQIKQINERIKIANNELQQKMKRVSLEHIIQINALRRQNKQMEQKFIEQKRSAYDKNSNQVETGGQVQQQSQINQKDLKFKIQQKINNKENSQQKQLLQN